MIEQNSQVLPLTIIADLRLFRFRLRIQSTPMAAITAAAPRAEHALDSFALLCELVEAEHAVLDAVADCVLQLLAGGEALEYATVVVDLGARFQADLGAEVLEVGNEGGLLQDYLPVADFVL
jgi:hypothetical protein